MSAIGLRLNLQCEPMAAIDWVNIVTSRKFLPHKTY